MDNYTTLYQTLALKMMQSLAARISIPATLMSKQRTLGDAVENAVVERFADICAEFSTEVTVSFSNRALEDVAFRYNSRYFAVDVKTRNAAARFSMPNLISVDRLLKFYDNPDNYFVLAMIGYRVISPSSNRQETVMLQVGEIIVSDIEHIGWQSLTIGALGSGQLQIKDASKLVLNPESSRPDWLHELYYRLMRFYEGEIKKNGQRLEQVRRKLAELEKGNT